MTRFKANAAIHSHRRRDTQASSKNSCRLTDELKHRIVSLAYKLSPIHINYWEKVDEVMALVADLYGERLSEIALTISHQEIMKWCPRDTDYIVPPYPINRGLARVVFLDVARKWNSVVNSHFEKTGVSLIPVSEFKKYWSWGNEFYKTYWYTHRNLTKEQAFKEARELGRNNIKKKVDFKRVFASALLHLKKSDARDDLMMAIGSLENVGNCFFYSDFKAAQKAMRSFCRIFNIPIPTGVKDVTSVMKDWIRYEASEEDKSVFALLLQVATGNTVRSLKNTVQYYQKNKTYDDKSVCLMQSMVRRFLERLHFPVAGRAMYPPVVTCAPYPWCNKTKSSTVYYCWDSATMSLELLLVAPKNLYKNNSRPNVREYQRKLLEFKKDTSNTTLETWLISEVRRLNTTTPAEVGPGPFGTPPITVVPAFSAPLCSSRENVAYSPPSELWAETMLEKVLAIIRFVDVCALRGKILPANLGIGVKKGITVEAAHMAWVAGFVTFDNANHVATSLTTWLPRPYIKVFSRFFGSCYEIRFSSEINGDTMDVVHGAARSVILSMGKTEKEWLFDLMGGRNFGKKKRKR